MRRERGGWTDGCGEGLVAEKTKTGPGPHSSGGRCGAGRGTRLRAAPTSHTSILEARASEWAGLPRRTPRAQSAFPSSAALPAALRSRAASSEAFDPGMLDSVGTPEVAFLSSDAMSPFVNVP